ncbi:MAG: hypothetical protein A2046_06265 [Bacteroidetes bacterium GWA2_30_7]|nr:MAG: hypothetical protein A2046_06265 [Bacteroidetes bacterium GWA2_30_7]
MLEFSKYILVRMSINENLFIKELRKLILWSKNEGVDELRDWCINNYGDIYGDEIIHTFKTVAKNQ